MSKEGLSLHIQAALEAGRKTLQAFIEDPATLGTLEASSSLLTRCFAAGNKVLSCGNGGSACDAIHFAEEFTGRFRRDRAALPVIPLTESSHLTCVGNDYGFDEVFARGVMAYGKPGDVLLGISTSGNSRNVIRAVEEARKRDMQVLLLLGKSGGALRGRGDMEILVPAPDTERVQEVHILALHILIESVERNLFPANYSTI